MISKKRKKVSRQRGSHTHSRGFKKKARGKGHRGGVGNSGSGKRADHKKNTSLKRHNRKKYFGKDKISRKKTSKPLETINLRDISEKFPGGGEVNLKGYKVLAQGDLKEKIKITASAASKSAIDKIKKAGGEFILVR